MTKPVESVPLRGAILTRKDIINVARTYSPIDGWKELASQKFVLVIAGKEYPPKKIAALAAQIPVSQFSGGAELNNKLCRLGFEIRSKS